MQACSLLPMDGAGGPCGALAGAFNTREELLLPHCSETRKRLKDLNLFCHPSLCRRGSKSSPSCRGGSGPNQELTRDVRWD